MRNNNIGESLVGIIVGVAILSIAILGILNIILYSTSLIDTFDKVTRLNILKDNAQNIIKNIDTSSINQGEVFYVRKNPATLTFDVFTGGYIQYKYIDQMGSYIPNLTTFTGETYARTFWIETVDTTLSINNQIIKAGIRRLIRRTPNN